ncbi:MAG: tRNA (guanosine(46)-N7)-methyltransferase TrmB [Proteobacteria bacterium]|nr:tRNA (guanosine(46)-N7)-methyltransferase TrmB [Pseudomonadota bacterium]
MELEEKYIALDKSLLRYYSYNIENLSKKMEIKHLEIGFGNGEYILNFSLQKSDEFFLGIEYSKKYFEKTVRRIEKYKLKNVKLLHGEAFALVSFLFPDNYFDFVHINFPDPWPKKRHNERRLININFSLELRRILKDDGKIFFASDFEEYFLNSVSIFKKSGFSLEYLSNSPNPERLSKTKYENEFIREGKKIFYSVLKKS